MSSNLILLTPAIEKKFKSIFLGTVDPHSEISKLKRAFNSQKTTFFLSSLSPQCSITDVDEALRRDKGVL